MKAKSVFAIGALLLAFRPSAAYSAGPIKIIKVAVTCSGDDLPGQQVCFDLKEKIRASKGFELVSESEAEQSVLGFGINLISIDIGDSNSESAISVAFTVPMPGKQLDSFVNNALFICGSEKVEEIATALLADLDKESEFLRER